MQTSDKRGRRWALSQTQGVVSELHRLQHNNRRRIPTGVFPALSLEPGQVSALVFWLSRVPSLIGKADEFPRCLPDL